MHLQRSAFETYCSSGHAKTIMNVREEYERLEKLTDDTVTWRIIPSTAEPFTVFFGARDRRLVMLPGFVGGVEYHPIAIPVSGCPDWRGVRKREITMSVVAERENKDKVDTES